jgi:superfamily II DNA or RNA helicase
LFDGIYIEIEELSKSFLNRLKKLSSFSNPDYFLKQKIRMPLFNIPRIITSYEINEKFIIIPRGLLLKLKNELIRKGVKISIEDKRLNEKIDFNFSFLPKLRSEQERAVESVLSSDYSIVVAPPGFGKTIIASRMIIERKVKTLILVHKTNLLEQWIERLCEYFGIDKKEIGILGKGKKTLNGYFDIAMIQSIKKKPEIFKGYSQLIIDESHHIPAVSFEIPIKLFMGKYIVGLSATPKRRDGMHHIMFHQCGDTVFNGESISIKSRNHTLKIIPTNFESLDDNFVGLLSEIYLDEERNKLIVDNILKLKDRKILILTDRIEHINILWHLLNEHNIDSAIIHGQVTAKVKKEFKEKLKKSKIIISTSSYIGEGVDIDGLNAIILTMPISFQGRLIQYLGRIGRQNEDCIAIDFVDEKVSMLKAIFAKRKTGYKKMGYNKIENYCLQVGGLFR